MKVIELFAGAGGMSLGLKEAGFDIVKAYDAWPTAVETYNRNIGDHAEVRDLSDILSVVPKIISLAPDMLVGGPPCQDYSLAGRQEEGQNAELTIAFAMIVSVVKPAWFMMENVTRAIGSSAWRQARSILVKAGYGLTESKIDCSRYGVPQSRRRIFVIGRLGECHGFLASGIASAAATLPMTLRQFFGVDTPSAMRFSSGSGVGHLTWSGSEPAPPIQEGNIHGLPTLYRANPDDAALIANGFVYMRPVRAGRGVRSIDEPVSTVTRTTWERPTTRYLSCPHPGDPVAASDSAVLTMTQISRIQGFPCTWVWKASAKRDIAQMVANAVPAPVAFRLGKLILDRENGRTAPDIEGRFLQWLVKRGRSRANARNLKALVGRARRLLGGRTFNRLPLEIAELESIPAFIGMRKGTQSDLRQALRLHDQYRNECTQRRQPTSKNPVNIQSSMAEVD